MHVILRGIDRSAVFFADDDYRRFLTPLADVGAAASVMTGARLEYFCGNVERVGVSSGYVDRGQSDSISLAPSGSKLVGHD
ncbi:MAG: hypothetical protein U9Q81_16675, partial [Pseudomonadota bacterium]|nr:hypothetical protein [Pseudomonadota bacterium]